MKRNPANADILSKLVLAVDQLRLTLRASSADVSVTLEKAVDSLESATALVSDSQAIRQEQAWVYSDLSDARVKAGKLADAIDASTKGLTIAEMLVAHHPDNLEFKVDLAGITCNRGNLESENQHERKRESYEKAVAILAGVLTEQPGNERAKRYLAINCDNLIKELLALADLDACRLVCAKLLQHAANSNDANVAWRVAYNGALIPESGIPSDILIRNAQLITEKTSKAQDWDALGMAHYRAGAYAEALRDFDKAAELATKKPDAKRLAFRALALFKSGDKKQAKKQRDDAVALVERLSQEKTDKGLPKLGWVSAVRWKLIKQELDTLFEETTAPNTSRTH